jgi:hypothetical protein
MDQAIGKIILLVKLKVRQPKEIIHGTLSRAMMKMGMSLLENKPFSSNRNKIIVKYLILIQERVVNIIF